MDPYLRIGLGGESARSRLGMKEIVEAISKQIQEDPSLAGCRLPPVRVLAHQLGVSKNTVSSAYAELQAKNLVESRNRTGLYVSMEEEARQVRPRKKAPLPKFRPLIQISNPKNQAPLGKLSLSSVFIDPRLLPKEKLQNCLRSVLKSPGLASFADVQGFLPLRKKIAERLRRRGIDASPEHIVTTVGSQQVLDLVCRSLLTRSVATENPAYYVGKALFEMNGVSSIGLPIDPFKGVDLALWERILGQGRPGLAYLTTNFQNPSGYSYTSQEISQILDWSDTFGFGILEDDWGSDMLSYSEFKPSLRSLGGDSVLYMNSFTKKLLPSLRLGYVLGNAETIGSLVQAKRLTISGIPTLTEAALFEFLDRGYYDAHLKKIQGELDERYQNTLALLRELLPEEVRWTSPGGGPVLWLELPRRVSLEKLVASLDARGIVVSTSHDAFFGAPHLHGFKLGYAFLTRPEMERAIGVLVEETKKAL